MWVQAVLTLDHFVELTERSLGFLHVLIRLPMSAVGVVRIIVVIINELLQSVVVLRLQDANIEQFVHGIARQLL